MKKERMPRRGKSSPPPSGVADASVVLLDEKRISCKAVRRADPRRSERVAMRPSLEVRGASRNRMASRDGGATASA